MIKLKAIIELFFLNLMLTTGGLWSILFNNKRVDFEFRLSPLYKRKPKKKIPTDKEIFLDFMARNT